MWLVWASVALAGVPFCPAGTALTWAPAQVVSAPFALGSGGAHATIVAPFRHSIRTPMSQALAKLETSIEAQQRKLAQLKAQKQKIEEKSVGGFRFKKI